jgi:hypothetical protein
MAGIMILIATLIAVMRSFFPALFPLLAAKVPGAFHDLRRPIVKAAFLLRLTVKVPFRFGDCGRLWSAGRFEMFFRVQRRFRGMMLYVRL